MQNQTNTSIIMDNSSEENSETFVHNKLSKEIVIASNTLQIWEDSLQNKPRKVNTI